MDDDEGNGNAALEASALLDLNASNGGSLFRFFLDDGSFSTFVVVMDVFSIFWDSTFSMDLRLVFDDNGVAVCDDSLVSLGF